MPDANDAARLAALLDYLESDPSNLRLMLDAASQAMRSARPELAYALFLQHEHAAPLPEAASGDAARALMQLERFEEAAARLQTLLRAHPNDANLRFNLAWCLAHQGRDDDAVMLLNPDTVEHLPQAWALLIQLLQDRDAHDLAFSEAERALTHFPEHEGLAAVCAVLALDLEKTELAEALARRAPGHPEAMATLGTLALRGEDQAEAQQWFDGALAKRPDLARAWIGKGLCQLVTDTPQQALLSLERGAQIFDGHAGSWLAAGWAALLGKEIGPARRAFEKALSIDHNFAETHGSLAVVAMVEGRIDEARRLADTALRLDRAAFSAQFATAMLSEAAGNSQHARDGIERILNAPAMPDGKTLRDYIQRFSTLI